MFITRNYQTTFIDIYLYSISENIFVWLFQLNQKESFEIIQIFNPNDMDSYLSMQFR